MSTDHFSSLQEGFQTQLYSSWNVVSLQLFTIHAIKTVQFKTKKPQLPVVTCSCLFPLVLDTLKSTFWHFTWHIYVFTWRHGGKGKKKTCVRTLDGARACVWQRWRRGIFCRSSARTDSWWEQRGGTTTRAPSLHRTAHLRGSYPKKNPAQVRLKVCFSR